MTEFIPTDGIQFDLIARHVDGRPDLRHYTMVLNNKMVGSITPTDAVAIARMILKFEKEWANQ